MAINVSINLEIYKNHKLLFDLGFK